MIEYFIRIGQNDADQFYKFCKEHKICWRHISYDAWVGKGPTSLYAAPMTHEDAIALKLSVQLDIMEIQHV